MYGPRPSGTGAGAGYGTASDSPRTRVPGGWGAPLPPAYIVPPSYIAPPSGTSGMDGGGGGGSSGIEEGPTPLQQFDAVKVGWFRPENSRDAFRTAIDECFTPVFGESDADAHARKQKLFAEVVVFLFKKHQGAPATELNAALAQINSNFSREEQGARALLYAFMKNRFFGPARDLVPKTLRDLIKDAFPTTVVGRVSPDLFLSMAAMMRTVDVERIQSFLNQAGLRMVDRTPAEAFALQIDAAIYPPVENGMATQTSYTILESGKLSVMLSIPVPSAACQAVVDTTLGRVKSQLRGARHVNIQSTRFSRSRTAWGQNFVAFTVLVEPSRSAGTSLYPSFIVPPVLKRLLGIERATDPHMTSLPTGPIAGHPFAVIDGNDVQVALAGRRTFVVRAAPRGSRQVEPLYGDYGSRVPAGHVGSGTATRESHLAGVLSLGSSSLPSSGFYAPPPPPLAAGAAGGRMGLGRPLFDGGYGVGPAGRSSWAAPAVGASDSDDGDAGGRGRSVRGRGRGGGGSASAAAAAAPSALPVFFAASFTAAAHRGDEIGWGRWGWRGRDSFVPREAHPFPPMGSSAPFFAPPPPPSATGGLGDAFMRGDAFGPTPPSSGRGHLFVPPLPLSAMLGSSRVPVPPPARPAPSSADPAVTADEHY